MLSHMSIMVHDIASEDIDWHRVEDGNTYWIDFGKPTVNPHIQFVIDTAEVAHAIARAATDMAEKMEADPNAK